MAKLVVFLCLFVVLNVAVQAANFGDCPVSSQVISCSPKCIQDNECSSTGGRCCPNVCNQKSCVLPRGNTNTGSGYKGSGSSATGTYCGNAKCNTGEKCDFDKTTKRQKCVRA